MKTIRSLYPAIFVFLTLPLLASMCSKKDSDPSPRTTHPSSIASVWAWQKLQISPAVGNIDDILDFYVQLNVATNKCIPLLEYDFKGDGQIVPITQTICQTTGVSGPQLGLQTGDKWSVSESKITITHADGSKDVADLELSDSQLSNGAKSKKMVWKNQKGGTSYTWVFVRQL